jgi:hypothetical protein
MYVRKDFGFDVKAGGTFEELRNCRTLSVWMPWFAAQ